jgi:hypothetical protein
VLAGTGTEDRAGTVLLASQDWKYLALLSKRDGGDNAKLFLINTSNDSVITMDEGNATFGPVGWSGHSFIYIVNRLDKKSWEPNASALKAFSADSGKIAVLDQTIGGGNNDTNYFQEFYAGTYILNNEIVFAKSYNKSGGWGPNEVHASLNTIHADGSSKRTVKTWDGVENQYGYGGVFLSTTPYDADGIYVATQATDPSHLYKYENGQVSTVSGKTAQDVYGTQYNTYLFSPSNKQTFWSEARDGKQTLFVGDDDGNNGKQIATLSDYTAYGWYTDNYLLVSKNGSELYIMPTNGGKALKITDYYKPNFNGAGYGKGYGAF